MMGRIRILVSWIGNTDLLAMAAGLDAARRQTVLEALNAPGLPASRPGPIQTLLGQETFSEVHLLSNYPSRLNRWFAKWLGCRPTIHPVDLPDPTDYERVFDASNAALSAILRPSKSPDRELCIHLSPGTPAMAAIWVLLGKSRYPATFFQTYRGKARQTRIPFDLVLDFVPELLREPDSNLQQLASRSPSEVEGFGEIVGESKAIRLAVGRARKAAVRDVPVLIVGESGTGKELFARAIHAASPRRKGPFIAINCAAIPRELLESELFGHRKGAFTGAVADRMGAFESADQGTLFLDEVGECDPAMQAKLLRVVQPPPGEGPCVRVFQRVGDTDQRRSDVRIIAATNRDLADETGHGRFREDLFYRLAVITLKLPPLRDRRTDIPLIARALLGQTNRQFDRQEPGYKHKTLSDSAISFVKRYDWQGNVRQLHNAIVQAAVMTDADAITRADLVAAVSDVPGRAGADVLERPLGGGFSLDELLKDIQRHYLQRAMEEAGGVKTRAARLLGMPSYQTLDAQLRRLGVSVRRKPSS